MKYDTNKLPDFFSVRNFEQIDYSLEGMEESKCYCFFDNGFESNVIEPNKRDIKFIWDGFLLFTDIDITLDDLKNGVDLYNSRLVAFQRTNALGKKFNDSDVRNYIMLKLKEKGIQYEVMNDTHEVTGYPSKADLWSTRDESVLIDAIDCTGLGEAYYFKNSDFKFEIRFNKSNIPTFLYSHKGSIVLRGENSTAISRLLYNDAKLKDYLETIIGDDTVYSYIEGKYLPGTNINNISGNIKKR